VANACMAASRDAAKPCVHVRSSWKAKSIDHIQGVPAGEELNSEMRPTIWPSAHPTQKQISRIGVRWGRHLSRSSAPRLALPSALRGWLGDRRGVPVAVALVRRRGGGLLLCRYRGCAGQDRGRSGLCSAPVLFGFPLPYRSCLAFRRMPASVALRTRSALAEGPPGSAPAGRRRRPAVRSACGGADEVSHTPRITAYRLAVDQAGPDLEVLHSLDDERIARRPVVTSTGDQPDAHGVATAMSLWDRTVTRRSRPYAGMRWKYETDVYRSRSSLQSGPPQLAAFFWRRWRSIGRTIWKASIAPA
jgi:hypothetical protein